MKIVNVIHAVCVAGAAVLALAGLGTARAERSGTLRSPATPEVGQTAPDFTLPDQDGKMHHLADYRGKTVVLAFYPKDFTGG